MLVTISMRSAASRAAALAVAAMLAACGSGTQDEPQAGAQSRQAAKVSASGTADGTLVLPLEVLGKGSPDQPVVAEAKLVLPSGQVGNAAQLWFQCHRCGFYAAPEFEATKRLPAKIKASVRVLGGVSGSAESQVPWIDITDANVTLADDERLHGGVNGGLYTTRITVALDAAARARLVASPGTNRVQFRFNGTDGESNGFRVLDLELRDASAARVDSTAHQQADPRAERDASQYSQSDAAAGKALWYAQGKIAKSSIVSRKLNAACASCHAEDARDLQYFNYSNNAIVQRSQFHGLSATQGR